VSASAVPLCGRGPGGGIAANSESLRGVLHRDPEFAGACPDGLSPEAAEAAMVLERESNPHRWINGPVLNQ
jgi:hypothetical protein